MDNWRLITLSILANIGIWALIYAVFKTEKLKLTKKGMAIVLAFFVAFFAWTSYHLIHSDFVVYWDFANYMVKQIELEDAFKITGMRGGFKFWFASMANDYTHFINMFTEFPYCFSSRSADAYTLCMLFNTLLPVLVTLWGVVKKVCNLFAFENNELVFALTSICFLTTPVLRFPIFMGQPDLFGLILCLLIVLLTFDYRFEKRDLLRWTLIIIVTSCLVVTRRWYLYFMIGYYFAYSCLVLYEVLKKRDKAIFFNLMIFGLFSLCVVFVLFNQMIMHIIKYDYADRYVAYNMGGFITELSSQLLFSTRNVILFVLGCFYICSKKHFELLVQSTVGWLIAIVMFTRVQNMSNHHHLLLMTFYLLAIIAALIAILRSSRLIKAVSFGAMTFEIALCLLTIDVGPILLPNYFNVQTYDDIVSYAFNDKTDIWSYDDVIRMVQFRNDRDELTNVANWIDEQCAIGEYVSFIPHDSLYNSDMLRYIRFPDLSLRRKITFGFDILGTEAFPIQIFGAKYVLTVDPYLYTITNNGRLSLRLNNVFMSGVGTIYKEVKAFDMGNGLTIRAYQRIKDFDKEELDAYRQEFAEEDARFPDLFSEKWDQLAE